MPSFFTPFDVGSFDVFEGFERVECLMEKIRIEFKRKKQLDLLAKFQGESLEALVSEHTSDWLIFLNGCYSGGYSGSVLKDIFGPFGLVEIQMAIGKQPYTYLRFKDAKCAQDAFGLNETWLNKKLILLAYARVAPTFTHPLVDPSTISHHIPGLIVVPDFISIDEETSLLESMTLSEVECRWQRLNDRKVCHYGFKFDYQKRAVDLTAIDSEFVFPKWCQGFVHKYHSSYPDHPRLDQLTLNHYTPGGGINHHSDTHTSFNGPLVVLSIGSIVMEFRQKDSNSNEYVVHEVVIPSRSLTIIGGDSRYGWEHCIRSRKVDCIDGIVVPRSERLSLTFRTVNVNGTCSCSFASLCT